MTSPLHHCIVIVLYTLLIKICVHCSGSLAVNFEIFIIFFFFLACASEEDGSAGEPILTPGLLSAFKAAESMRRELVNLIFLSHLSGCACFTLVFPWKQVEAKQKLMEEKEKEENEEKKAQVDEDTPGN